MKGFLITFEYGRGVTQQSSLLRNRLVNDGLPVVRIREPEGSRLFEVEAAKDTRLHQGRKHNGRNPDLEEFIAYSFVRNTWQAVEVDPLLKEGRVVLLDRHFDPKDAYQRYGRGLTPDQMHFLQEWILHGRGADITYFVGLDSLGRQARKSKKFGKRDNYEKTVFNFYKLHYRSARNPDKMNPRQAKVIPYIRESPDKMHEKIVRHFYEVYNKKLGKK